MFGSLCGSGQNEEGEGQTQVTLSVKKWDNVTHPDQVFRTSRATSGYLRQQGSDPQGSGCGSAVPWYLVCSHGLFHFVPNDYRHTGLI